MRASPDSFADAEARKEPVEQVIRVDGADHFTELAQGAAEGQGREFGGFVEQEVPMVIKSNSNNTGERNLFMIMVKGLIQCVSH